MIILSPPGQSKIISPSPESHFNRMHKVSLPSQVTHTQVLGDIFGELLLPPSGSLCRLCGYYTLSYKQLLWGPRHQHTGGDIYPGGDESGEE